MEQPNEIPSDAATAPSAAVALSSEAATFFDVNSSAASASSSSLPPTDSTVEQDQPGNRCRYNLRDREVMQKRRAASMEKASKLYRGDRRKQTKRGRRQKKGQIQQLNHETTTNPHLEPDSKPDALEAGPAHTKPALADPVPPETSLASKDVFSEMHEMQVGPFEGELPDWSLYSRGEVVLQPSETENQEDLNASLESHHQDNE
ncbi:uncharacterized protein LOC116963855 isoform X2 [Tyto alba]|uniref:uncharacterized protein LOC116963855 isoform X2 n=1 Tax=Tyto alba TaxID=56313 RepID=UPI001403E74F|nr:uncharacterized protein LOC116963855 isoform X2 [Tyto alba]